jgi:hypothetical protein
LKNADTSQLYQVWHANYERDAGLLGNDWQGGKGQNRGDEAISFPNKISLKAAL